MRVYLPPCLLPACPSVQQRTHQPPLHSSHPITQTTQSLNPLEHSTRQCVAPGTEEYSSRVAHLGNVQTSTGCGSWFRSTTEWVPASVSPGVSSRLLEGGVSHWWARKPARRGSKWWDWVGDSAVAPLLIFGRVQWTHVRLLALRILRRSHRPHWSSMPFV